MEIKDYLHLYLGCRCKRPHDGKEFVLSPLSLELAYIDKWQPILRPLSDMTKQEASELCKLLKWRDDNTSYEQITNYGVEGIEISVTNQAEFFRHIISKYFDIFGLIDAGLAINSKTL